MESNADEYSSFQSNFVWIPLAFLWGYSLVSKELIIAIIALIGTLLTILGNIIVQGRSLKRDSGTIGSIHKKCAEEISPTVKEIRSTQTAELERLFSVGRDIAEIRSSSSSVQRQVETLFSRKEDLSMQPEQVMAFISGMYAQHDRDWEQIADLQQENARLKAELEKYRPLQRTSKDRSDRELER